MNAERDSATTARTLVRVLPIAILAAAVALLAPGAAVAANPTSLSINCTPKGVSPGTVASCAVTVTDTGPVAARVPPSGTVTLATDGAGTFDPGDTCALEPVGAFSSKCTIGYTATAISGGSHRLAGTYNGEEGHGRATSVFTLTVTPVNDELDNAILLPLPGKLTGTTEGATFNYEDDPDLCSDAYAPVWYVLKAVRTERIAVRLTVGGRIDSVVAVFRQDRSKLADLGCALADTSGVAGVPFDVTRGASYLVAVAAPWDARVGAFTIETFVVPPVKLPGAQLARDADLTLDPLLRPSAAFSVQLRQAVTYRIDATAPNACLHVTLLRRPTPSAETLAKSQGCSGYLVFTPGPGMSGSFPIVVSMPEGRAAKVHVALRTAEADDLAPGIELLDATVRHGRLAARDADVTDVYRFRVPKRGDATVALRGTAHADLVLIDAQGKQLACACDGLETASIVQRLPAGSYFAVVRARPGETGTYALSLRLREPTTTTVRLTPTAGDHALVAVAATVAPAVGGGRLVLELERFDPLTQWHFATSVTHRVAAGRTGFTFGPKLGGWRVRVRYGGTLTASPSISDWIEFTVDATAARASKTPVPRVVGCAPRTAATFTVGGLILRCLATGLGAPQPTPTSPAKSPAAQLRDLRAVVAAIVMLKDPFRSELLGDLDAAITAVGDRKADDARAKLDDFITTLQSPPLQAQLTADQRDQLIETAKRIEGAIGT
jgi:hypothetical protein